MAEFVVNITLLTAVLVLLVVCAVAAARRRRRERREQSHDRRVLLAALTGAAAPADEPDDDLDEDAEALVRSRPAPRRTGADGCSRRGLRELDEASLEALLAVLEDGRRPRRGLVSGLFASPKTVWGAGARAGHSTAQRFTEQSGAAEPAGEVSGELFRDAADELLNIHTYNPADARRQYADYAAALGSPQLARLYLRSAAHAAYRDPAEVAAVIDQITGVLKPEEEEASDGNASVDA